MKRPLPKRRALVIGGGILAVTIFGEGRSSAFSLPPSSQRQRLPNLSPAIHGPLLMKPIYGGRIRPGSFALNVSTGEPKQTTSDNNDGNNNSSSPPRGASSTSNISLAVRNTIEALKLVLFSSVIAVLFIGWEDLSMAHPLRSNLLPLTASAPSPSTRTTWESSFGQSTVRGLGFGMPERQKSIELEKEITQEESSLSVRSYNEVLLEHRAERIPSWISEQDISLTMVKEATRTIQLSLLQLQQCQNLAANYEWDKLSQELQDPLLHSRLEKACSVLKRAPDNLLSIDARDDIGFDWGSCAWRHCGALADAQEALDELDHLVGVLEPFEALFCLDIVERSFRDMLAVTEQYQDPSIKLSVYKPLERMSDLTEDEANKTLDDDYLAALETVRAMEEQEAAASGK